MMGSIHFLLVGFGITNSIVFLHIGHWLRRLVSGVSDTEFYSSISNRKALLDFPTLKRFRIQFFGRMFRCHACMGFWVGSIFALSYYHSPLIESVLHGFALSAANFILWVILVKLGAKTL
jgi:hypothetical protein